MDYPVIVLCIIAGAGAAVVLAYAATHAFFRRHAGKDADDEGANASQVQYMREVRWRNHDTIAAAHGFHHMLVWMSNIFSSVMGTGCEAGKKVGINGLLMDMCFERFRPDRRLGRVHHIEDGLSSKETAQAGIRYD